eukprot:1484298-Rhodomonas_salina.1
MSRVGGLRLGSVRVKGLARVTGRGIGAGFTGLWWDQLRAHCFGLGYQLCALEGSLFGASSSSFADDEAFLALLSVRRA